MATPSQPNNAAGNTTVRQGNESPPLSLGPKRLHYQFSAALPQVHLTLVSIVQGIAFGVLFQDLPVPRRGDIAHLGAFLVAQLCHRQQVQRRPGAWRMRAMLQLALDG